MNKCKRDLFPVPFSKICKSRYQQEGYIKKAIFEGLVCLEIELGFLEGDSLGESAGFRASARALQGAFNGFAHFLFDGGAQLGLGGLVSPESRV